MKVVAYCDGSSQSNPGPAGSGAYIWCEENHGLATISWPLGIQTNNVAEYDAVVRALYVALALGATEIEIRTDSETLVRQVNGEYAVRTPHLRPLHKQVLRLLRRFPDGATIEWVPRTSNTKADELAGQASGANPDYDKIKRERKQRWSDELARSSS